MNTETPIAAEVDPTPFDANGVFDLQMASCIALELRASGNLEAADALEQMASFFRTSEDYIYASALPLPDALPSHGSSNLNWTGIAL